MMIDLALPLAAAFLAGVLNTIAGGGTFLTFPALVFAGIPPVVANATSAVAVFPGYLGGALGFRKELGGIQQQCFGGLLGATVSGACFGSWLLMISSNDIFSYVVPALLFIATLIFTFSGRIQQAAARRRGLVRPFGFIGVFLVSVYGGYFNGGLGIVLLALYALWGMSDIHSMNGLKNGQSFALSAVSVGVFTWAGLVAWNLAIPMMVAGSLGGFLGAPVSRLLPKSVVKGIVSIVGVVMTIIFTVQAIYR